jgi:uncharacterized protein YkwD
MRYLLLILISGMIASVGCQKQYPTRDFGPYATQNDPYADPYVRDHRFRQDQRHSQMPPQRYPDQYPERYPERYPNPLQFIDHSGIQVQLLQMHNSSRSYKAMPLSIDRDLQRVAQGWAEKMAYNNRMTHKDEFGREVEHRCRHLRYRCYGENIGFGYNNLVELMDAWMRSPDHYENIMNKDFRKMGVGVHDARDGKRYYCVVFGG